MGKGSVGASTSLMKSKALHKAWRKGLQRGRNETSRLHGNAAINKRVVLPDQPVYVAPKREEP